MLLLDDVQAREQVVVRDVDVFVEELIEFPDVALRFEREFRQIDRREREVAAAAGFLRAVDVAHDARAAAHRRDVAVVVAFFIILKVVRRVEVHEIREQALRARLACLLEQVVVRVAGVIVDAGLELEDGNREDRRLAVAEARPDGVERLARREASFGRRIHAVVDGRERHLCARAAVERVEVVNERLHGLMRLFLDVGAGEAVDGRRIDIGIARRLSVRFEQLRQRVADGLDAALRALRLHALGIAAGRKIQKCLEIRLERLLREELVGLEAVDQRFARLVNDGLAERFADALGHRIVEAVDGLPAEHVVLVALDRDARKRRVRADAVRLAQEAMPCRKTAMEEL